MDFHFTIVQTFNVACRVLATTKMMKMVNTIMHSFVNSPLNWTLIVQRQKSTTTAPYVYQFLQHMDLR